jgi:hypothetical protein
MEQYEREMLREDARLEREEAEAEAREQREADEEAEMVWDC